MNTKRATAGFKTAQHANDSGKTNNAAYEFNRPLSAFTKGELAMKPSTTRVVLMALALALLLSVTGCTSMTGQTAGQYVDDATITTSVKAKLVADKAANFTRIDVDTTNHVVALNGVVESAEQKARAQQLAMEVSGVHGVNNNLQIQKNN